MVHPLVMHKITGDPSLQATMSKWKNLFSEELKQKPLLSPVEREKEATRRVCAILVFISNLLKDTPDFWRDVDWTNLRQLTDIFAVTDLSGKDETERFFGRTYSYIMLGMEVEEWVAFKELGAYFFNANTVAAA